MANEKRLINANEFLNRINNCVYDLLDTEGELGYSPEIIKVVLGQTKTIDAVEVVHGRWEKAHIAGYLKCNCCKDAFIYEEWLESGKWSYCPNCGASMRDGDGNA